MKKEDMNIEFNLDYEEKQNAQEEILTHCVDCVFELLPKQCDFDIPSKVSEKQLHTLREEDNQEHYAIEGFCKNFRPEIWKTANQGKDLKSIVEEETALNISFILIVRNIKDIAKSIEKLNSQNPPPKRIVLTYCDQEIDHLSVVEEIRNLSQKFPTEMLLHAAFVDEFQKDERNLIDDAFRRLKTGHYSVFETGYDIPEDWSEKINKAINTDRKQVCYIRPIEGLNGMTCQTLMHSFLYGHNGASLEQKLEEGLEADQNENQMIFDWEEIK